MPRFRKKPVVIEAVQYDGTKECFDRLWDWLCPSGDTLKSPVHHDSDEDGDRFDTLFVDTLEGPDIIAKSGDWIIKGVAGEVYPCKPNVFEATYDPVD